MRGRDEGGRDDQGTKGLEDQGTRGPKKEKKSPPKKKKIPKINTSPLKNGSGDMKTLRYGGHDRILRKGFLII